MTTRPSGPRLTAADTAGHGRREPISRTFGLGLACLLAAFVVVSCGGGSAPGSLASGDNSTPTPSASGSGLPKPVFFATGSMNVARYGMTATLLPDGRVLIVGGCCAGPLAVSSAEVYDPKTGKFSLTGSLATGRYYHTATLLPDGRVLIVGGLGDSGPLASAEVYDSLTGKFAPAGSMVVARYFHTATLMVDNTVLIVGGFGTDAGLSSAELYDPTTAKFSLTGAMVGDSATVGGVPVCSTEPSRCARYHHTATALPSGKVLVAGGALGLTTAELYDPATRRFTEAATDMTTGRTQHTATLLPDGRVLVAGGRVVGLSDRSAAELYDPKTGKFTPTGPMTEGRDQYTATLLKNGLVLMTGGVPGVPDAELYNPKTGTFSATGSMLFGRYAHTATLLQDGRVLIAGGTGSPGAGAEAELYAP